MIALFSGTGNSLLVARALSKQLGDEILDIASDASLPDNSERIIWVFPVYSWGLPPVLAEFIGRQSNLKGRSHWCVMTCGDDVGYADRAWHQALSSAGASDLRGIFSVEMPNTYVCLPGFDVDSAEVAVRKLDAMPDRVESICQCIRNEDVKTDVVRGALPRFKTRFIYPVFRRLLMSARPFRSTDACISCGLCAKSCPLHNITMAGGLPAWGGNCTLCLRCYHICPQHAVARPCTKGKGQKQVFR